MNSTKMHQEISSLYIETTELCNLHCKYCYNKPSSICKKDLSLNSIVQVLHDLAEHKMYPHLILSGGEFLMRRDYQEVLNCLTLSSPSVTIATNGLLLNDRVIRFIQRQNNIFIQVSLDGMTDQDNFYRGIKTASIISTLKRIIKCDMRDCLSIRMTIHKKNWHNIEQILLFCHENRLELRLSFMCYSYEKPETKEYLLDQNEIFKTFCLIREFNKSYNCDFQLPDICVGGVCGLMKDQGPLAVKIDVEGNIYACQAGQSSNFLLGNLSQTTVYNCTYPENLKIIRKKIMLRNKLLQNKCSTCTLTSACFGRCVAHVENEEGSFYKCSDRYRFALERYLQCGNVK